MTTSFRLDRVHSVCPSVRFATVLLTVLLAGPVAGSAQTVEAVVDNMKARYEEQLRTVDTFVVEVRSVRVNDDLPDGLF